MPVLSVFLRGASVPVLRAVACLAVIAALAGCASQSPVREAADYKAHAKRNYTPPGPPGDPWGPYITEASARFDVPDVWIREVMRQESGGRLYENGQLITSDAGAMGLMQVMPGTYDELRGRYNLDDDPYDPHNNILAGTAYIRELYDVYGSPGFLAAYNAGPGKFSDYITRNKSLPLETRNYVARIGPRIAGVYPTRQVDATQVAMYQIPTNIPAGPRYPRGSRNSPPVMLADTRGRTPANSRGVVLASALPEPPAAPSSRYAATGPNPLSTPQRGGFHLIQPAMAGGLPVRQGGPATGGWAIQVGAYGNEAQARAAATTARGQAANLLASARPAVGTVKQGNATLYRARLTGLSRDNAIQACEKLGRGKGCMVLSPDAQT